MVDFVVPADQMVKLKEGENKDKWLDPAKELKEKCRTWKWQWYQL